VSEVARVGRNTQGVTLIRLPEQESLVSVERVAALVGDAAEGEASDDLGSDVGDEPPPTAP
jgi:DNA gyrase subunit A